tara:strand:- start:2042 stop:2206 length:165 start_codon:yes stop_codon:yes gene_type:complete
MIDFGKYTSTIISAYGGASVLIIILLVMTILKSRKVNKELLVVEQKKSIDAQDD